METVCFVLSSNSADIKKLLEIVQFSPFEFYRVNFFEINFETFLILPLKKHFLDIETFLLSHLIWTDNAFITLVIEQDFEMIPVFNRMILYMSNQIEKLCEALSLQPVTKELIWAFFKKVFLSHREVFHHRYLEQIIMCSVYAICKVTKKEKIKFQQIFSHYQEISNFSKYLFHCIVFKCKMEDDQKGDIIKFYNEVFIPLLKGLIMSSISSQTTEDMEPQSKVHKIQRIPKENFEVINSPLSQLISTPFTYYNKSQNRIINSPYFQMYDLQ